MSVLEVFSINNNYYFNFDNKSYIFMKCDRQLNELNSIFSLYRELVTKNIFVDDIILNKNDQVISLVNNTPYVLLKDNTKSNNININDLIDNKKLLRNNWINLWGTKIDYYESYSNELLKKYPALSNSLDYYIGLGENSISYLVNNSVKNSSVVLSHKRIQFNNTSFDFYNPFNFIIDSRVRDFAEYMKDLFFNSENFNYDEYIRYIDYMNYTKDEYILLISRLLFPTYYFDLFDQIVNENISEDIIKNVLNKNSEYISFLKNTFYYIIFTKRINIPIIEWIINYQN